jgi:hypothetical protein
LARSRRLPQIEGSGLFTSVNDGDRRLVSVISGGMSAVFYSDALCTDVL